MIYEMNDRFIDLSKLEMVSKVTNDNHDGKGNPISFWFNYTICGKRISSSANQQELIIKTRNDNLIKAWKEYKDQK